MKEIEILKKLKAKTCDGVLCTECHIRKFCQDKLDGGFLEEPFDAAMPIIDKRIKDLEDVSIHQV